MNVLSGNYFDDRKPFCVGRRLLLRFAVIATVLFLHVTSNAQQSDTDKKVKQELAKEVTAFKAKLSKSKSTQLAMEFAVDTFRVETTYRKYLQYDYSNAGMIEATYNTADQYDSLLNKYYKRLLAVFKAGDKTALINAQKSWIAFRDNEMKLVGTISKDEYSGGGTIQRLLDASERLTIIRERTLSVYQHYARATQDY